MRNYLDRCRIVPYNNAGAGSDGMGGIGGERGLLKVYEDVPCQFSFMDALKAEALFGAQSSKGALFIPHYVDIPEQPPNRLNKVYIGDYYVQLLSPRHPLVDVKMPIDTIRWTRVHLILQVDIPYVA